MKLIDYILMLFLIQMIGSFEIIGKWKLRTSSATQCILNINFQRLGNGAQQLLLMELSSVQNVSFVKAVCQSFLIHKQIKNSSAIVPQTKDKQIQSLILLLEANVVYFSIRYDQLLITSVFESSGYNFYRVEPQLTPGFWNNSYYLNDDGQVGLLFSDGDTFSLCQGNIIVNYAIVGLNRLVIFDETIKDNGCNDKVNLELKDLLFKSRYFRILENGTLQMLDYQYHPLFNLNQLPQYKKDYVGLADILANLTDIINQNNSTTINLDAIISQNSNLNSSNLTNLTKTTFINNTNINDLLGSYTPGSILGKQINVSTKNILYLFGTNTIFLTGTCLNYKFDYNIYNTNSLNITQSNYKQVLRNSKNCTELNDQKYITPLIEARAYQKSQSKVILYDINGKIVYVLTHVS